MTSGTARRVAHILGIGSLAAAPWLGCGGGSDGAAGSSTSTGGSSTTGTSSSTGTGSTPSGSEGCGTSGPTGTFSRSVMVGGVSRTFYVSVPASYDEKQRHPLVFGYHGGNDYGGQAMRDYLDLEAVSPAGSELFVYPDATAVNDPGGEGFIRSTVAEELDEDAFFDAIVDFMAQSYCVDRGRIFATGQSQGGSYVQRLACTRGDVIRALVPVAGNVILCGDSSCGGWNMDPSQCVGAPAVMDMHGKSDTTVPLSPWGLGSLELLAGAAGCGPWKSGDFPKGEWTTFPTSAVDPAPCQQISGCRGSLSYCWYDGEHQIPSWYPEAKLDYPKVTMAFFRSH